MSATESTAYAGEPRAGAAVCSGSIDCRILARAGTSLGRFETPDMDEHRV
jgi:hypothetical protein